MKKIIATCFALAALGGCATEVPEAKQVSACDVPPALLATCGAPGDIKVGITFGELLEVSRRDREALRECTQRHEALSHAIAACNAAKAR